MHPCHFIAQPGSNAPPHMPSIMDASQSIAVPRLCWEAQKREQRCSAFIDPNLRQSQGQMGCCSMTRLIFLSNRRPWRGIAIVARSEEEWTVDSSGFPLLHYVSDMNNSSVTNRKKSEISWWTGPNKVVKHPSADVWMSQPRSFQNKWALECMGACLASGHADPGDYLEKKLTMH